MTELLILLALNTPERRTLNTEHRGIVEVEVAKAVVLLCCKPSHTKRTFITAQAFHIIQRQRLDTITFRLATISYYSDVVLRVHVSLSHFSGGIQSAQKIYEIVRTKQPLLVLAIDNANLSR